MNAEIITVGTEILIGSIVNTNGPYLSKKLTDAGYDVVYHASVRDNYEAIRNAVENALTRSDAIFLSGGLGPTQDDMTKQSLARALGLELVFDESQWDYIRRVSMGFSKNITENNKRQAEFPKGAVVIPNARGTAPGCMLEYKDKQLFMMPGPPREFEPMADDIVLHYLKPARGQNFITNLRLVNIGESQCESMLRAASIATDQVEVNTFAKTGEVEIKVLSHAEEVTEIPEVEKEHSLAVQALRELFQDYLYAEGEKDLFETLVELLSSNHYSISFAESVTGGTMAHMITSVAGASRVLQESYITYSNAIKEKLLGVDPKTVADHTVVSEAVASEMSRGLYERTKSNYCISTTGEAGPESATGKDVGTVIYSIRKDGDEIFRESRVYKGDRTTIQYRSSKYILARIVLHELGEAHGRK
ncbi:MAG: competence/damage-inducible protein A [Peptoniphilus sp.]|nr:competence/damage-inducible protein A [Peptoniphilus sp.]MDY3119323.1 competence/damage-inducible protein A [Peptoniphilus sp.]